MCAVILPLPMSVADTLSVVCPQESRENSKSRGLYVGTLRFYSKRLSAQELREAQRQREGQGDGRGRVEVAKT